MSVPASVPNVPCVRPPVRLVHIFTIQKVEKGLLSFFYSMPDDSTEEDVTLLCSISAERLEELVNSLIAKGVLDYESGYRLDG